MVMIFLIHFLSLASQNVYLISHLSIFCMKLIKREVYVNWTPVRESNIGVEPSVPYENFKILRYANTVLLLDTGHTAK